MQQLRQHRGILERRLCWVQGPPRSTQLYRPQIRDGEAHLTQEIIPFAGQYGRDGYRRITALLRTNGGRVKHTRVERIWRQEGFKVPKRHQPRWRLWRNDGSCSRLRPAYCHPAWAYDFVAMRTTDGRALRLLVVVDSYSRECLAIEVARRLRSDDVLQRLTDLFVEYGSPAYLRSDNGLEFTAQAVRCWLARVGVHALCIEPGRPWENGYVESVIGTLRDEWLNGERFFTVREAQVLIEQWRQHDNQHLPHRALGSQPPAPAAMQPIPPYPQCA